MTVCTRGQIQRNRQLPTPQIQELFRAAGLVVFERGWLSANNILFHGSADRESTLVDTGYCSHAAQTVALTAHALGTAPLDRIINTHLHSDHCGGNLALQLAFGCRIDVPAGDAATVDRWDEEKLTYKATGQLCPRFERSGSIDESSQLLLAAHEWQVISAGGHDPNSVVLYQPDLKILLSADALWENGFGVIFPEIKGESGFADARATLDRIASLAVRCVIPGHGSPFADLNKALGVAYQRLDRFVADPVRHALHAAKVLVKFHLLAVLSEPLSKLLVWIGDTPYLQQTHSRYFGKQPILVWAQELIRELVKSGALRVENKVVFNE